MRDHLLMARRKVINGIHRSDRNNLYRHYRCYDVDGSEAHNIFISCHAEHMAEKAAAIKMIEGEYVAAPGDQLQ